jgi:hypothetical protein
VLEQLNNFSFHKNLKGVRSRENIYLFSSQLLANTFVSSCENTEGEKLVAAEITKRTNLNMDRVAT